MKIFDIGANRGLFTDKCLTMFGDELKILTIEANPTLCTFLEEKYKFNNSVTVINTLMSVKDNELVDFFISNADTISTSSLEWVNKSRFTNDYVWHTTLKLKSSTIDSLILKYGDPDLIKIDVEGYELEVLKGLTKKTNEICFEWAEEQYENINKTVAHLQLLGYNEFGYIMGDEYMKKPDTYTLWEHSDFHKDINPDRKEKWGMIWTK
jgi:FkbM family methyltransferase